MKQPGEYRSLEVLMPGSTPEDFERGYHGHGRAVVVTQEAPGEFSERPMTAGEIAAREPAWAIGADPYEFMQRAAFAYIRSWEVIAPAIDAALAAQAKAHDRRVTELLSANTSEVERRREAEAVADALRADLDAVMQWYRNYERAHGPLGAPHVPDCLIPF